MEKEKADDKPSVSLLFYDFLGYTTVHGAGRIVASGHWIRKLCWGLLILGTLGFLTMQIPNLYQMYRERPLATRVAIEHDTVMNRLFFNFSLNLSSKGVSRLRDKKWYEFFSHSCITLMINLIKTA